MVLSMYMGDLSVFLLYGINQITVTHNLLHTPTLFMLFPIRSIFFFLFSHSYPILLMFSSIIVSFLCGHYFYHVLFWVKFVKSKLCAFLANAKFPLCELFFTSNILYQLIYLYLCLSKSLRTW